MTKEEIEKEVRAIERRCRGPHRRSVALCVQELASAVEADPQGLVAREGLEEGAEPWFNEASEAALLTAESTRDVVSALLEQGKRAAAGLIDAAARTPGCGQDMNDLMLAAGVWDGERHEVTCPRCKTVIQYTPALYVVDAAPAVDVPSA